jgi:3-oxoacyl-[acyl-carrier protein] reductase
VADSVSVKDALAPLLETDCPQVLVNNAGFSKDGLLVWMEEPEWKSTLSVHLDGFFFVTKMVLFEMLKRRSGRIINIVSTSGQSGMAGQTNYSAAKAGLIGATKSLAWRSPKGTSGQRRFPGFIETDMTAGLPRPDHAVDPVGADGETGRSCRAGRFLASDKAPISPVRYYRSTAASYL